MSVSSTRRFMDRKAVVSKPAGSGNPTSRFSVIVSSSGRISTEPCSIFKVSGAIHRDAQPMATSLVIGRADREHAAVLDGAFAINDVVGRAAAHVDDHRAQLLVFGREHRERERNADGDVATSAARV